MLNEIKDDYMSRLGAGLFASFISLLGGFGMAIVTYLIVEGASSLSGAGYNNPMSLVLAVFIGLSTCPASYMLVICNRVMPHRPWVAYGKYLAIGAAAGAISSVFGEIWVLSLIFHVLVVSPFVVKVLLPHRVEN
ncbi:MAG: hypothetical protein ACRC6V_06615 [Bacteroidales bacterium]